MTESVFNWAAPALPDLVDSGVTYTLAVEFRSSQAQPCTGVQWRVPDTAPTGTCTVALWRSSDQALLASKNVSFSGQAGQTVKTYFDSSVNLNAGDDYRAGIWTPDRYCATTSFTWPHTDGILTALVDNGWFRTGAIGWPENESGNAANYHVSPIVGTGTSGTASASLGALSAVASGARVVVGTASAALGGLAASMNALASGSRGRLVTASVTSRSGTTTPPGRISTSGGGRL